MNPEEGANPTVNQVLIDPPTAIRTIRHRIHHDLREEIEIENRIV